MSGAEKSALQLILEENQDALESMDASIRGYYGRGGSSVECLGVVDFEMGDLLALIIENTNDANREELADTVRVMRTDSMGKGTIVYFPGVVYVDPSDEPVESEELS